MKELAVPLLLGAGLVALDLAFDHKSKKKQEEKNQRLYSDALTLPKHQRPRKYRSHNEIRERHEYYSPKLKRRGEYDGVVESDHEYVDFQPRPPSSTWENSDIYGDNGLGDYAPAQDPGSQIWKSPSHNIRYKQLRRKFVRLLRIPPKSEGAELHCILFHEDLETTTVGYEALSYHWGDSEVRQTIYCYDSGQELASSSKTYPRDYSMPQTIKIGQNLHAALERLRRKTQERIIWVDALCINQKNEREKFHQLPFMHQIYQQATRVIVWLGEAEDEERDVLIFLQLLSEKSQILGQFPESGFLDDVVKDCVKGVFGKKGFNPLVKFFHPINRGWYLRRWVIQEVAASVPSLDPARDTRVYCGRWPAITWKEFATAVSILDMHPSRIHRPSLSTVAAIDQLRRNQGTYPILVLLTEFHLSRCADSKDRIRALLSLSETSFEEQFDEETEKRIEMSADAFYFDFADHCLRKSSDHLELLHCGAAFQPPNEEGRRDRSSWIPDWRAYPLFEALLNISKFVAGIGRDGLARKWSFFETHPEDGPRRKGLNIRGIEVGKVHTRSKYTGIRMPDIQHIHTQIPYWIPVWEVPRRGQHPNALVSDTTITLRNEPFWQAFARTIVADHGLTFSIKSSLRGLDLRHQGAPMLGDVDEIVEGFADICRSSKELRDFVYGTGGILPSGREAPMEKTTYSIKAQIYAQLVLKTMGGPGGVPGRCFFCTYPTRYMGIGPDHMRAGDTIAIFFGARTPFIIRPDEDTGHFRLIGDCYIHGLMDGEALEMGLEARDFQII